MTASADLSLTSLDGELDETEIARILGRRGAAAPPRAWFGRLHVYTGPMFAGKTSALIRAAVWARHGQGQAIAVLKPAIDRRYAERQVVNHDGMALDAVAITAMPAIDASVGTVLIDEGHLCCPPGYRGDLVADVRDLLESGKDVHVSLLDMDWRGKPFAISAMLIAMADHVHKFQARCSVCGEPATKTIKLVPDGERIAVGGKEAYAPRCNLHWRYPTDVDLAWHRARPVAPEL